MRLVVRSDHDVVVLARALADRPADGYLVEVTKYKAPRTRPQNKKVHAMIDELAEFNGDSPGEMKQIIKGLNFWPTVIKTRFGVEQVVAKSEADFSKQESELVIEHLYMLGSFMSEDGFAWSVE